MFLDVIPVYMCILSCLQLVCGYFHFWLVLFWFFLFCLSLFILHIGVSIISPVIFFYYKLALFVLLYSLDLLSLFLSFFFFAIVKDYYEQNQRW